MYIYIYYIYYIYIIYIYIILYYIYYIYVCEKSSFIFPLYNNNIYPLIHELWSTLVILHKHSYITLLLLVEHSLLYILPWNYLTSTTRSRTYQRLHINPTNCYLVTRSKALLKECAGKRIFLWKIKWLP